MSGSWISSIQKFNSKKGIKLDEKKLEEDVRREFQKIMESVQESNTSLYTAIPRFYTPKVRITLIPKLEESVERKVKECMHRQATGQEKQ